MSNIITRSKRYDEIQRAKKLRRRKKDVKFKKKQEKKLNAYKREQSVSLQDKIKEALEKLKI